MKIKKECKVNHAYLVEPAFIAGVGSQVELTAAKGNAKDLEMYLQPNGQLYCRSKGKWFTVPESNVRNYILDKSVEIELG